MEANRIILIVDDEPVLRVAITETLTPLLEGFDLLEAADGREALRLIDSVKPELVVLDLLMPNMDGIEVLMELRDREGPRPVKKIVVVSAVVEPNLVDRLQQLGADRVLEKPFRPSDLLGIIEDLT